MPRLSKSVIANFLRSGCDRRLRLDLSPDNKDHRHERLAEHMPPRVVRPGLAALSQAGRDWEQEKTNDLLRTFGKARVRGDGRRQPDGTTKYRASALGPLLEVATAKTFLIQPQYGIGPGFKQALGIATLSSTYGLRYSGLVPDIIQVLDSRAAEREVLPDGTTRSISPDDDRLPLRVVDIKLTAEASVPYFGELTYYSMALSGWLEDKSFSTRFLVGSDPAVWPGSHIASSIVTLQRARQKAGDTPTLQELLKALEEDLEPAEWSVFAPRIRRFFSEDLGRVLSTSWTNLDWHVDNRCIGCEYLGYPWPGSQSDPSHCWPSATATDQLSRVAFVSRGARGVLEGQEIRTVAHLASTQPGDPAYDEHHLLRATRTVVGGRATSLGTGESRIPRLAGTSAVMPRWADLRLYLTADFDVGSGITLAFGLKGLYWSPTEVKSWAPRAFVVERRSIDDEKRELLHLLTAMRRAMDRTIQFDQKATVQVFVWDSVSYEHTTRVIGRHLDSIMKDRALSGLAWLFPPTSVVPKPEMSDRSNPVTRVRDVVRAVLAAPVPHYYSLLNVAREYHPPTMQSPYDEFRVPPFFEDPLSDQVPSERAHEIWSRMDHPRPWLQQITDLERIVKVKLDALEQVTRRLSEDLSGQLRQTAPRIANLGAPSLPILMADDARLWYVYAQFNAALERLEIQHTRSMPAHEREARFRSAMCPRRLSGEEEERALEVLGIEKDPDVWTYELSPLSRETKAREGDFGFALSPAGDDGFLDRQLHRLTGGKRVPLPHWEGAKYSRLEKVTQVTVRALDRDKGLMAVGLQRWWAETVHALERLGLVDLSQDVVMDPVHLEFLLAKLKKTLNKIGNPPAAVSDPVVQAALHRRRRPRAGSASPVGDCLWDAPTLHEAQVPRQLGPVKALMESAAFGLNSSQWDAWEQALTYRFRLIWGPPGTGKSRTLRAICLAALHEAHQQARPIRVLVTGPTYEAIDNVLLEVHKLIVEDPVLGLPNVVVQRLRSSTQVPDPHVPQHIDLESAPGNPAFRSLAGSLLAAKSPILVGATLQQTHKLLAEASGPVAGLFDLIMIDEASQVDVAQSTLAIAGLDAGGSVVVAGDPKQLAPIHRATPPDGLDYMVGSVFSYFQTRFPIVPCALEVNYRSASDIVDFAHASGYRPTLSAVSPDLKLNLVEDLPSGSGPPSDWPADMFWTPEWSSVLAPDKRLVCFVYPEGRSSQWNRFEAEAAASLTWMLWKRLGDQLASEIDPSTGHPIAQSERAYGLQGFWKRGLGIVTPHRAQQALITARLGRIFPDGHRRFIRESVDTVERFQGQQRDTILASFSLGDPDAIRTEDEFLLNLNRFNVMVSRTRAKFVLLVSQEVVDHLSADMEVLKGSALLKSYAETFCNSRRSMQLGYLDGGAVTRMDGSFRWHNSHGPK